MDTFRSPWSVTTIEFLLIRWFEIINSMSSLPAYLGNVVSTMIRSGLVTYTYPNPSTPFPEVKTFRSMPVRFDRLVNTILTVCLKTKSSSNSTIENDIASILNNYLKLFCAT